MKVDKDGMLVAHGRRYSKEYYEKFTKYKNEYNKQKYKQFIIRARVEEDADVIEFLMQQESLNAYIFGLIRKDMNKKNSKK